MAEPRYHVFLSHNSREKAQVLQLAEKLERDGIHVWVDKWNLIPGEPWQEPIEKALQQCDSCAICVGPLGTSPWQNEEMRASINMRVESADNKIRVIPVLLPGASHEMIPDLLARTTWVEFRESLDDEDALYRLTCGIRGVQPVRRQGETRVLGESPYRGLQAFEVEHGQFFFGREKLTDQVLDALKRSGEGPSPLRFVTIVGTSGSGKSSLAKAGVLAAVKHGRLGEQELWRLMFCRPESDPVRNLAIALSTAFGREKTLESVEAGIESLIRDETTLDLAVRLALDGHAGEGGAILLVHQFEECFTRCRDEARRKAFTVNLLHAARVLESSTYVLITLRADEYGAGIRYLGEALTAHQTTVDQMNEEELRRAIEIAKEADFALSENDVPEITVSVSEDGVVGTFREISMIPGVAIRLLAMGAFNSPELTCVVPARKVGFGFASLRVHTMSALWGKFEPRTRRVKTGPPAATEVGSVPVSVTTWPGSAPLNPRRKEPSNRQDERSVPRRFPKV